MDPGLGLYVADWLHLVVRWLHITAAIAWIGTSFYFMALDYSMTLPKDERAAREGVGGESWEIHAGGFYRIEKFRVAPAQLPASLRWFKWEAYTTWLSGFALLVLLYYVQAETYLVDRSVADLASWQAVALSVVILGVGWLAYDALSRWLADRERLLAVVVALLVVVVVWVSGQLFSPRAAYIQAGATIGTWMVANVFFVIIPGQRELVAAKLTGREPDPLHGVRGNQRSVHNNYLTLPVLFAMISHHFPFTYGHPYGWLVLLGLMAAGAAVRHFFNLRHQGRMAWGLPIGALAIVAFVAVAVAPSLGVGVVREPFSPAESAAVRSVITERCVTCHSVRPTYAGITAAPKGIAFETSQQIKANAPLIYQQVVATRLMPLGNVTGMTEEERQLIARWFRSGAPPP